MPPLNLLDFANTLKALKYLMEGNFSHMLDLVNNPLRNGINLSQRIENVQSCFNMGTNGKYYHGEYKEWLKYVRREKIAVEMHEGF